MKSIIPILYALAPAVLLAGCMEGHPAATSDDVLAAQYGARAERGALTGPEATIIAQTYRRQITAAPTDPPANR